LTLFESIFQLDGNAFVDSKKMVIELEMNLKETELMTKLNKGLCVLYMLNIMIWMGEMCGLRCKLVEW